MNRADTILSEKQDKTTLMPEPYHKRISVKQEISLVIHIKTNQKTNKKNKADKCDSGTN